MYPNCMFPIQGIEQLMAFKVMLLDMRDNTRYGSLQETKEGLELVSKAGHHMLMCEGAFPKTPLIKWPFKNQGLLGDVITPKEALKNHAVQGASVSMMWKKDVPVSVHAKAMDIDYSIIEKNVAKHAGLYVEALKKMHKMQQYALMYGASNSAVAKIKPPLDKNF